MKKVLKFILLIILIIFVVIGIPSIYKINIIKGSRTAIDNLEKCDTYKYTCETYHKTIDKSGDTDEVTENIEVYYKDNIYKKVSTIETESDPKTVRIDYSKYAQNEVIEVQENTKTFEIKKCWPLANKIDTPNLGMIAFYCGFEIDKNFLVTMKNCIQSYLYAARDFINCKVKTEIYENKECYKIDVNKSGVYSEYTSNYVYYIEKETMLPVCEENTITSNGTTFYSKNIYTMEINCVKDEDISFPDLSDYTQLVY